MSDSDLTRNTVDHWYFLTISRQQFFSKLSMIILMILLINLRTA